MTATIKTLLDVNATIKDYHWTSKDKTLEGLLNAMLETGGPSGSDPAPDYHAALRAVEKLGGEVIEFTLPEFVKGRIY